MLSVHLHKRVRSLLSGEYVHLKTLEEEKEITHMDSMWNPQVRRLLQQLADVMIAGGLECMNDMHDYAPVYMIHDDSSGDGEVHKIQRVQSDLNAEKRASRLSSHALMGSTLKMFDEVRQMKLPNGVHRHEVRCPLPPLRHPGASFVGLCS